MKNPSIRRSACSRGSALLIVLAFLLLLTTLTVAFLSRATFERQLSNASFSQGKVDLAGQGAINAVICDLQQEMVAGSNGTGTPTLASGFLYPTSPANAVPALVGFTQAAGLENLLKVSRSGSAFYSGGPSRASSINTANTSSSLNNRVITLARWNAPLLLAPTSSSNFTPAATLTAPDWIYVARDGSNPGSSTGPAWSSATMTINGANPVTQRYAYAIYDEGGTLDLNVAGSPFIQTTTPNYSTNQPYKNALPYADLTQLPYTGPGGSTISSLGASQSQAFVNAIVGWRNFASSFLGSGNIFPNTYSFAAPVASADFDQNVIFNPFGFMTVSGPALTTYGGAAQNDGPQTGVNHPGTRNQTDNAFVSRQQLLQFFLQGLGQNTNFCTAFTGSQATTLTALVNVLPYFGTFSRDLSQPSYAPNPSRPTVLQYSVTAGATTTTYPGNSGYGADATINPAFLATTATTSFTRNDGSTALGGEPLVKRRFALNRLAWLTYEGPSATVYAANSSDANLVALMNDGIPASFLQQGTAPNIQKYFGLDWDSTNHVWDYDYHNNDPTGQASAKAAATGSVGPILQLGTIAGLGASAHDPDFFELLKATIGVGSLGKALLYSGTAISPNANVTQTTQPYNWNYYAESSVDYQILQIGANIIAQFQPANYAPQIVFNDGSASAFSGCANGSTYVLGDRTIVGVENLPYLSLVTNGTIVAKPTNMTTAAISTASPYTYSGIGAWMQVPVIWDPCDPTSNLYGGSTSLTPVKFRVVADSATPDQAVAAAAAGYTTSSLSNYNPFFVYGAANGSSYSGNSSTASPYGSNNGFYSTASGASAATYLDSTAGTNISNKITASNSEIDFTVTPKTSNFCPEPVALLQAATIKDSNGNSIVVSLGASHLMTTDPALTISGTSILTGTGSTKGLPSVNSEMGTLPANTTPYLGFYLGAFPLAWMPASGTTPCVLVTGSSSDSNDVSAEPSPPPEPVNGNGAHLARSLFANANDQQSCYMTYRMQYQDPNSTTNWITYDTKYGQAYGSANGCGDFYNYRVTLNLFAATDAGFPVDPRTSRFGLQWNGVCQDLGQTSEPSDLNDQPASRLNMADVLPSLHYLEPSAWIDSANGIMYSLRPDAKSGFYALHGWPKCTNGSFIGASSGWMANVASSVSSPGIAPGLLSQNNTDIFYNPWLFASGNQGANRHTPDYFADPDGVVRRGMGAYIPFNLAGPWNAGNAPADTTVGLPMAEAFVSGSSEGDTTITTYPGTPPTSANPTSQAQSRPYFLHRPFYSVAELGYVFSDTPWRNLDFFTAESGNAALLDTFCINDTNDPGGLVAGKVNLNTRQVPVLQAVLASGYFDPAVPTLTGSGTAGQIDSTTANLLAQALVARTTDTTNIANGTGPLQNMSELVGKYVVPQIASAPGQKGIQIQDMGTTILNGYDEGTLNAPSGGTASTSFADGKLSYAGFSGGVWDNTATTGASAAYAHCPYPNPYSYEPNPSTVASGTISGGVEDFTSKTGAPKPTTAPEDVYAALLKSSSFSSNANHNGTRETVTYIQRFREAPIRALSAVGTTRVWNLMIDVIAQTGRFPSSASSLANFNVEGERRYWVHVAIDRYTGKVLDEQVEEVKE